MLVSFYVVVVAGLILLLSASVLGELLFAPNRDITQPVLAKGDTEGLTSCHQDVTELFKSLGTKTSELLALAHSTGARSEIATKWDRFSNGWSQTWTDVGARCSFEEPAEPMGAAFDRIALVHAELPTVKLKYQSLLHHFEEEQAAELARMRNALNISARSLATPNKMTNPNKEDMK